MTNLNPPARPRILLVDDETELRIMLGMILSDEGYEITHTGSSREAIRLHGENPFSLIIAELLLKEKNGFETLTELRRLAGPTRYIATVKSCWLPREHILKMAQQLGAHSALCKPFHHEEMLDAVRNALG